MFLARVPYNFGSSLAPGVVKEGWEMCGWDEHDFEVMASTSAHWRLNKDPLAKQVMHSNLTKMHQEFENKGILSEAFLDEMGVPDDDDGVRLFAFHQCDWIRVLCFQR